MRLQSAVTLSEQHFGRATVSHINGNCDPGATTDLIKKKIATACQIWKWADFIITRLSRAVQIL